MRNSLIFIFCLLIPTLTNGQDSDLAKLKHYAEQIKPIYFKGTDTLAVPDLPSQTDSIINVLERSYLTDKKETEKYLVLIFLKLYREQLKCCHQGYEFWGLGHTLKNDPFAYYFFKITNVCNPDSVQECPFVTTGLTYNYVIMNKYLYDYSPIKVEMDMIEKLRND